MKKKKLFIEMMVAILVIFLISSIVIILSIQQNVFFYPWHDEESYKKLQVTEKFKEIEIYKDGKKLSGWLKFNTDKEVSPLIIFFGGNMQNSSNTCISFLKNDNFKYFKDYNFLMVDYPGYGLSEGKPSDKTMFEAGLMVYDYACNLDFIDKNNIAILGYSIGTGVATYVASNRDVNGLILIAPYDEALSLYNAYLNIFHGPLKILAKYKFDSKSYAKNVKIAPLIFTSYDDEVISYKFTLNLEKYFKNVDKTIILENIKHNDYFSDDSVLNDIFIYLQNRI